MMDEDIIALIIAVVTLLIAVYGLRNLLWML